MHCSAAFLQFVIHTLAQMVCDNAVLEVVSNDELEKENDDGQHKHQDPDPEDAYNVLLSQRNPFSTNLP